MFRKIFVILISLVMVFSLSFSVFAEEAPESAGEEALESAGEETADSVGEETADSAGEEGESSGEEGESAEGESGDSEGESGESSEEEIAAFQAEMDKKFGGENFDPSQYTPIDRVAPENDIHTDLQYSYIMDEVENVYAYGTGKADNSIPKGIICDFSEDGIEDAAEYIIQRATTEDFAEPVIVTGLTEKTYTFNNLLLGEHFYWRAGTSEETIEGSPVHEVTVADIGPRNCYIDGMLNVRDIGGYASDLVPGGKIRQGLYYRGATPETITEYGKYQMTEELGIRAEVDVRDENDCNGPYVDGVEYYACPIPSETEDTRFEEFSKVYVKVFDVISHADESPVYLHCTHGADRSGISTFALLTVLGVSYEDTARDYLFTNLTNQGPRFLDNEFNKWYSKLDYFAGDTKAEQAKNWLMMKGVPEETIERIREIFVEGYTAQ